MAKRTDAEWAYLRLPEWAWNTLSETIAMDIESSSVSLDLRTEIEAAFETVEHLVLVSKEEVILRPGTVFDIIPADGGVVIRVK
jgi:hypothetical protein